jgi:hypothetical protein
LQETNFQLGGGSAEAPQGGVIFNQITQLGPTYGRVSNIQRGRLIKVGFNVV